MNPPPTKTLTVEDIKKMVARAFGLTVEQLVSKSYRRKFSWPRQIAMYLARKMLKDDNGEPMKFESIAAAFERRDHGTAMHACKMVKDFYETQPGTKTHIDLIEQQLLKGARA